MTITYPLLTRPLPPLRRHGTHTYAHPAASPIQDRHHYAAASRAHPHEPTPIAAPLLPTPHRIATPSAYHRHTRAPTTPPPTDRIWLPVPYLTTLASTSLGARREASISVDHSAARPPPRLPTPDASPQA
ncbi:hypothetical protein AC579_1605 [Pseudocercospora musae]|uniref:Uncharacterized protein n=1 Tax=Pseudocercospora musae TaxID=113226 RepID=A0A139H468_9PEZI|nr:hypothetical protein AC579_1605 [Pseudocercospora musae]